MWWYAETAALALAGLAVVESLLVLWQIHENLRFTRSRLREHKSVEPRGHVVVLAPCKGVDLELEQNLRPLFEQDYEDYELAFIVENETDPAAATIHRLFAAHPERRARLVVAGLATDCGQKVHNLRAATANLSPDVDVLAFVDSDSRPACDWLRHLVSRLDRPRFGASTGYRWFVPVGGGTAAHVLSAINAGVASLLGTGRLNMVWGGSWAIRRDVFERIGLRDAWQGTLSDDLVASRVLRDAGLLVNFEPACMVASPLETSPAKVFEFVRRQYVIGRFYAPRFWAVSLVGMTLTRATSFAGLVALPLVCCGWMGSWAAWLTAAAGALTLIGVARAIYRQRLAQLWLPRQAEKLAGARRFDLRYWPLVAVVNWVGLASSLLGDKVTWRGNRYQILPGGQIRLVSRDAAAATSVPRQAPRAPHFDRSATPTRRTTHSE